MDAVSTQILHHVEVAILSCFVRATSRAVDASRSQFSKHRQLPVPCCEYGGLFGASERRALAGIGRRLGDHSPLLDWRRRKYTGFHELVDLERRRDVRSPPPSQQLGLCNGSRALEGFAPLLRAQPAPHDQRHHGYNERHALVGLVLLPSDHVLLRWLRPTHCRFLLVKTRRSR